MGITRNVPDELLDLSDIPEITDWSNAIRHGQFYCPVKQQTSVRLDADVLAWLKAQKQAIAAREKKKVSDQQRKDDTRRKILLGAWALNKLKNDESFKQQLADFEQFLNTENKTEENKQKDKDLFNGFIWDKT